MLGIPLNAVSSQKLSITLAGQPCQLSVYTLLDGAIYMDVLLNGSPIVQCARCLNNNKIVRAAYTGFIGDFIFTDTQGSSDPTYDGLGARYQLVYLESSDL